MRVVDRDKLRRGLERLKRRDLLVVLDRALVHVPTSRISEVVDGFIAVEQLEATAGPRMAMLDQVKAFHEASRSGKYYESFNVNSKNYMERSAGTENWIVECNRLLGGVIGFAVAGDPRQGREAFELIFPLLKRLDEGADDIVFFADEGGSWQVHVEWPKVLPAYFRCLAATAAPAEYAQQVREVVADFVDHDASKYVSEAREAATQEQKAALAVAAKRRARST